jgi:serine protease inhibitor
MSPTNTGTIQRAIEMVTNLIWKRSLLGLSLLLWGGCKPSPPGGPGPSGLAVSSPSAATSTAQPILSPSPTATATPKPIAAPNLPPLTNSERKELEQSKLLDGYRELAFELLHLLSKELPPEKNLIFSPYSIGTSLTLLYLGASGSSKQELAKLLHIEQMSEKQVLREFELLKRRELSRIDSFSKINETYPDVENINAFWLAAGRNFVPSYIQQVQPLYPYFLTLPANENTATYLKQWIQTQSRGQVGELDSFEEEIAPEQNSGLLSALYLRAHWYYPFESEKTQSRTFTTETAQSKVFPFMVIDPMINQFQTIDSRKDVYYSDQFNAQAIKLGLAYTYDMMIVLPKEKSALTWAKTTTAGEWYGLKSSMEIRGIQELAVPRWTQKQSHNLLPLLQTLGASTLNQNPDFSNLMQSSLKLGSARHYSALTITEDGVGGGTVNSRAQNLEEPTKQLSFVVDKPFFYTIHDDYTNAILYMGTINDPTQP